MFHLLCMTMIFFNVVWDLLSALTIWISFCNKDVVDLLLATERNNIDLNSGHSIIADEAEVEENSLVEKKSITMKLARQIAAMHTSMWARQVDATNHAACMLMAWWVLTLGLMRMLTLYNMHWILLAALSYALEGCAFLAEALKSTMITKKACPASLFSFFCMMVCVMDYYSYS